MSGYAALVTGGRRGIGKAIAINLAKQGFGVAINAEADGHEVQSTVAELTVLGVPAAAVIADIGKIEEHEVLLDAAEAAVGPLTTLVNNAGVSVLSRGDLLDVSPESYDRCLGVNTRGTFFLSQAWARRVLARDRNRDLHYSMVTISSSNAEAASVLRGEYCISKAGLSMMAKLFAVRLGKAGIGSYELQPGLIETDMTAPALDDYRRRVSEGLTVAPYVGKPDDVASVASALATGQLKFCVGQSIQPDGGLLIPRF